MIFHQGDQVVHRSFGVGKVKAIEVMKFTGNQPGLYYNVEFFKTTVWVPVENEPTRSLRPITPKKQLNHCRALLESAPSKRNNDFVIRKNALETLIHDGTFQALCEVVRDLDSWNRLKPLNNYEHDLLKQARASLAMEWSLASGLPVNQVLEQIDGYLAISSQSKTED